MVHAPFEGCAARQLVDRCVSLRAGRWLMGVVLVCAIAGRVNLPGFMSALHAQDIILVAVRWYGDWRLMVVYYTGFYYGYFDVDVLRF